MEEENIPKKTEDIKKAESTQDFEMGSDTETPPEAGEQSPDVKPKINNYLKDIKKPSEQSEQPKVNPSAPAPKEPPTPTPEMDIPKGQTLGQAKTGPQKTGPQMTPSPPPKKRIPNPAARKKAILGCLGGFGAIMLILLVLSFIFIAQSGEEPGPIAELLGLNQASFTNSLITLIHIIFILVSLVAFVFVMVGLFKASMAKKEDKEAKRTSLKMSIISGIVLFLVLITWVFAYAYLDAKRIQIGPQVKDPIVTEPEEPTNLEAPVTVKFDASNIPVEKNYKITFYEWDFGDGESGTGQIVNHKYETVGKFDVILDVTMEHKDTGDELPSQYSVTVSVTDQALTASFTADPQSGEAPLKVEFDASESVDPDGEIESYEWDLDEDGEFDDAEGIKITHEFEKIGVYTVALRVTSTLGDYEISEMEIVVEEKLEPEAVITIVDEPYSFTTGINYVFKAEDSTSPKGEIEKYEWDFNDGTAKETTKTVSHVFTNAGIYEVTLKVTDEQDNEGETTKKITVLNPQGTPKAVITTTPAIVEDTWLEGSAPFEVIFDGTQSTDSDNNIVEYQWDFESDGTTDNYGPTISFTYQKEGTYTAKLTVIDSTDFSGTDTVIIKVLPKGIDAVLEADEVEGNVPLTVKFDASGSTYDEGQIASYEWDFGDGTSPKLGNASITHKYKSIGTYTASIKVIGTDNTFAIAEILITVREIPLQACFTSVFEEGIAPLETTFDPGCSTGTISSYYWEFGDAGTSTDVKPGHTYDDPGEYTATLEISDSQNNISTFDLVITVTEE